MQLWRWGGERLERDEDPDWIRDYSARGNGVGGVSVQGGCLRGLALAPGVRGLFCRKLAVVQSLRVPTWAHGALDLGADGILSTLGGKVHRASAAGIHLTPFRIGFSKGSPPCQLVSPFPMPLVVFFTL